MSKGNEPAYPGSNTWNDDNGNWGIPYGLSKREYFAGLAMQAILSGTISNTDAIGACAALVEKSGLDDYSYQATHSVKYADALLAELEKTA